MTTKENNVKQHAKVAEEAVSGWEKAEAEASALKNQLESVTLLKLTAEDRAAHLDGALKECMRQIRNVKEESEQNLHDVVFAKTKQWEKAKLELDSKIENLEQELFKASAENEAISREISSLKYELHIVSKELEIRSEEKNMSIRSAEVANKQQLESVKKITKLEAECQRLRGLVRKKLPGPAALAQMKLEVENMGRDNGDPRLRRSSARSSSPRQTAHPEFSLDNFTQSHKEAEFLTSRLLAMEEETKMLKEALSKRNSELQASRNLCAKTASRLRSVEAQIMGVNQQKGLSRAHAEIPSEGFISLNESNPPSLTSMSEDGVDEEGSCADSWATALISELSHFKKEKNSNRGDKAENANHLELMDDFLEMEKLACTSTESNGTAALPDTPMDKRDESASLAHVPTGLDIGAVQHPDFHPPVSSDDNLAMNSNQVSLSKLQSRIAMIFESEAGAADMGKILEDIKHVVQDTQVALPQHSVSCIIEETHSIDQKPAPQDIEVTADSVVSLIHESHVTLLENKVVQHDSCKEGFSTECLLDSHTASNPEVLPEGHPGPGFELQATIEKHTLAEFEQLKVEKSNLSTDLARCTEGWEQTRSQLLETEQLLGELKSQLTDCQKTNSLSETQLKCMVESYKTLESHAQELESEINRLRSEIETLNEELQEEKRIHEDDMVKYNDLQEQFESGEVDDANILSVSD
ncbi:Filament-like plant protein 4 [Acorus calamus]|uniref:Filament-like plant protein 4 n=1 Tax=Acorus calamus TaxID=4465 RepID=A0AAV9DVW3_ACOCL|nr:Filament-like plant protein 4 [Acorus calamus]